MANIEFAGFVLNDAGTAINGAVVNLYDRNTTTPSRANTTTNSAGYWTISHGTEGRFDIEITSGDSKRRIKYDDAVQLIEIETANLLIRNPADTFKYDIVPAAIVADRAINLPLTAATTTFVVNDFPIADAADLEFGGTASPGDVHFRWSTADADNHAFVLALGASQAFHITDVGAIATNWNIAATTHPNVYIHSNTTPATDYLRLGDHDGTTAYVDVVGGTTLAFEIGGTTEASLTASALDISGLNLTNDDDDELLMGTGGDYALLWSDGDSDNHAAVIAIGNSSQALHVTDYGARATDWNIAATTHPNLYIHSNTTPASDYLRLGDHDGTTAYIDVVGGTTIAFEVGGTTEMSLAANTLTGNIVGTGSSQVAQGNHTAPAASATASGHAELATTAEIETGTDTTRIMPIDQFVASDRNIRFIEVRIVAEDTDVATATTKGGDFRVPFTGTIIQDDNNKHYFCAYNDTAGATGTMVVDVHLNGTTIMTTNKLDIETTEKTTADAATQPDVTTTAVTAGDILTFDIDAIHTTAAKGLVIRIPIRLT